MRFWLLLFALVMFIVLAVLLFAGAPWETVRHIVALVCIAWAIVVAALLSTTPRP